MATTLAEAKVRTRDGAVIIDLSGDIDAAADEVLSTAYADAAASGPGMVVLNFEKVNYINSTGIALIVGVLAQARKEQREVKACGLTEHYRHIFEITRLADFMPMFDDETTAVSRSKQD
jgi:anti-sigma B factor antagonist